MLTAARELQIPLLAVMLLGGCAAKAWRVRAVAFRQGGHGPGRAVPAPPTAPDHDHDVRDRVRPGPRPDRYRRQDRHHHPEPARDHRPRGQRAVLPYRHGRTERDEAAAPRSRLRLFRRLQPHPGRGGAPSHAPESCAPPPPSPSACPRSACRRRPRRPRCGWPCWPSSCRSSRSSRRNSARSWSGSAIPNPASCAGSRSSAPWPPCTRAHHGAGTRARSPVRPRSTCGGKGAGDSWCTPGSRGAGGLTSCSPSTCSPAGP